MSYTWEQVMLGIDVEAERRKEAQDVKDVEAAKDQEANWAAGLSTILGLVGSATPLGPIGSFIGQQIGTYAADLWAPGSDWEQMAEDLDLGKFSTGIDVAEKEFLKKQSDEQWMNQILNTFTDLATTYVQAGGLTAKPGEFDFTTYGSGDAEWSVFGRGTPGGIETVPDRIAG